MKANTRITFVDEHNEKFFGEGPARLMRAVEQTGSLRAAAMSMGMAYTKALKLIRNAEHALGFPLITRTTGGRDGGGSRLTDDGLRWLGRYEAYRDACVRENQHLYRKFYTSAGCVIMASGMGIRFGGNKLMADFLGRPMFLRAIDATEGLFDRRVVVTRHEDVARICLERGIRVVLHDLPHRSDTVRLGLEALGDVDCCMFLPGDQPLLHRDTVRTLLDHWTESGNRILRPVFESTPGSPVIFPKWTFPELRCLPEGKGGGYVMANHPDAVDTLPVSDPLELTDADTPETLELLKEAARRRENTILTTESML